MMKPLANYDTRVIQIFMVPKSKTYHCLHNKVMLYHSTHVKLYCFLFVLMSTL